MRYDESLPPYARRLLDAATAMRDGNYAKSESLYVASTRSRPGDAETWFGLGDLYYHYNALRGRSKREARRPFERALALDPGDGESRVHLLELAAWEGKVQEVDSLLDALPPGSDFAAKWPIVRALITDDRPAETQALSGLKAGDERSLVLMVIHSTSAFPSNLPGALRVTGMLTDPARTPARRAYGYNLRAQVQLARGRWSDAKHDLTAMATIEPAAAIEYGALLALSPAASTTSDDLRRLRTALATWDAAPTPPSASPVFGIHNGFHPQLRLYLLGLVSVRLGDAAAALAYADSLAAMPADSIKSLLGENLAHAVRARVIARRGDVNAALAELGQPWIDPRTHRSHYSSILAQVGDRYFRAELLQKAGRLAEALDAYSAVSDYSLDGLMYLPLSSLRRGDIYLQMRDRPQAIAHYQRFIDLWKDCDPRLVPLREAAVRKVASLQR
jgi:tetratricopeptide (TPR) repeat protein